MKYDYKTINTETLKGLKKAEKLQKQGWDVTNVGMFSIQFKRQTPLANIKHLTMKSHTKPFALALFGFELDNQQEKTHRFLGYYNPNSRNQMPYFTKETVELIIAQCRMPARYPPDSFTWKGDNLLWQDSQDSTVITLIKPVKLADENLVVYPIGHGSWVWERTETDELTDKLARAYAAIVRKDLKLTQIRQINKGTKTAGDFCDANELLLAAWEALLNYEITVDENFPYQISNDAISIAIAHKHWAE